MIYVDEVREYHTDVIKGLWCHMWTDEEDESGLHALAKSINIKRTWFQTDNQRFRHYDLSKSKRALALKHGAVFMPLKDWINSRKIQE